jgi:hypothetical protein
VRTDLDHLPERKQRELERIVEILHEEFEDALALGAAEWKKRGRILKIILFGSYARGTWVDEPHTTKGYRSDFDLLIVVNNSKLTEHETYWYKAADRLLRDRGVKTPVSFIAHSRREVNEALHKGQYFFSDIRKEGIVLYELDDEPLAEPKPVTFKERYGNAKEHFDEWHPSALEFFDNYLRNFELKRSKTAAFELHQAVERSYHCLLLTLTNYTPPSHNLKFLRSLAEEQDRRLAKAWPRDTQQHRAWFNRLSEAYVKARYSKNYTISEEALRWLGEQAALLHKLVEAACQAHLAELRSRAENG